MATPAHISAALAITGEFNLITGAAVITDNTPWATLNIVSPNTVAFLLYIQDPFGRNFYKNAGYDTANFSAPDFTEFATDSYSFTLPTDVTGAYITGVYTINIKVQVNQSGILTNAAGSVTQNVSPCCAGICASISPVVTYSPVAVGVTDNTNYYANGGAISVANTLTLYPPPQSGEASQTGAYTGTPATLYFAPPSGQNPYTGVWQYGLSSILTYLDQLTNAVTICKITNQGSFSVVQSPICTVLCYLKKYEAQVIINTTQNQTEAGRMTYILTQAQGYLAMMQGGMQCGWSITSLNSIAAFIYELIGADPECDCGCGGTASQQIMNGMGGGGTPGTNGLSFRQGTGAPSGSLGVVGDSYLDNATGNVYLKTGASTWAFTINIKGAPGSQGIPGTNGTSGQNGTSGTTLLCNLFPQISTVGGGSNETLLTVPIPANTLAIAGDMLKVRGVFTCPSSQTIFGLGYDGCFLALNGVPIVPIVPFSQSDFQRVTFETDITLATSTTANNEFVAKSYSVNPLTFNGQQCYNPLSLSPFTGGEMECISALSGLNFAAIMNLTAIATAPNATFPVILSELRVEVYHAGTPLAVPTIFNFPTTYANPAAAIAAGCPQPGFFLTTGTEAITYLP